VSAASVRQLLQTRDPDCVLQAVELIRTLREPDLFAMALRGTHLHDGHLRLGPLLSTDGTTGIHAALALLGAAPATTQRDPSLRDPAHLDLSWETLGTLPHAPGFFRRLSWLDLSENPLHTLPDWVGTLARLRGLALTRTGLARVPDALGSLTGLRALYLDSNQLTALPPALSALDRLEDVFVNHNRLTELSTAAGWPQLRCLVASCNTISALPDSLPPWRRLVHLELGRNPLGSLPPWLPELRRLEHLGLAHTDISELPEGLGALSRLRRLDLRGNPIGFLPTSLLDSLPALRELDLRETELSLDQVEVLRRHRRRSPLRILRGSP